MTTDYPETLKDRLIRKQPSMLAAEGYSIERQLEINDVVNALADERVCDAVIDMLVELIRAEKLHPVWPDNTLRQVAIMAGEAGEALQAGLHYAEGRGGIEEIRTEIVQTGAMSIRALINLDKLDAAAWSSSPR
jgi:hypothetical protein